MGYIKAEDILPNELIDLIQMYIDGHNIYIPRKSDNRSEWGSKTSTKKEIHKRNVEIYQGYLSGMNISELAGQYYLSEKSIQRIIRNMK